jgi:hypothetical protein
MKIKTKVGSSIVFPNALNQILGSTLIDADNGCVVE